MQVIFIAIQRGWEYSDIIGVFDTEAAARLCCTEKRRTVSHAEADLIIEAYEVNGGRISDEAVECVFRDTMGYELPR